MLQAIDGDHDPHFVVDQANSLANLAAAQGDSQRKHVILAASGSVATIKIPVIIQALAKYSGKLSIRIILTESARHFLDGQSTEQPTVSALHHMPNVEAVYDDAAEWGPQPWRRGTGILHIELRRWADMLVVAPLSANTLAKVVNGMSDNLLTSVIRAWDTDRSIDGKRKLILVAPAMNTAMWRHPITAKQIRVLSDDWGVKEPVTNDGEVVDVDVNVAGDAGGITGENNRAGWFVVIQPISKALACGDTGDGAMASVETIVEAIEHRLGLAE
ncbi:flavoprotein [Diplogelasinospora grovesii]|uniref:Flavoprotein n=1 Tax=Diplogelasinospora grovesii TaxID=303347 RepID=A0AAN6NE22_9PEZI|nr:flavoprotein [Diplogelasinospora grovesii]